MPRPSNKTRVLAIVKDTGMASAQQIGRSLNIPTRSASKYLKMLHVGGHVRAEHVGGHEKIVFYYPAEA